jgi:hypothetical protein
LIPFLKKHIPDDCIINDYGSGTGRADVELLKYGHTINMVDISDVALEQSARDLIGAKLTYTISPLESLPVNFPVADWGICINVLMTVDPLHLDKIMNEMRRTCHNVVVEVYDLPDLRLGRNMTTIKGSASFWYDAVKRYWPIAESHKSPEHIRRYITIGRSK